MKKYAKELKQKKFLATYAGCGSIRKAAELAEISRQDHYNWLKDPEYAQRFADAHENAMDLLLEEARRRGWEGWDEPVVYQGGLCYPVVDGKPSKKPLMVRKYDAGLLQFLIKGGKPEYRDSWKAEIKHSGAVALPTLDVTSFSDDQLTHISSILQIAGVNDTGAPRALAPGSNGRAGEESEDEDQ